MSKKHVDFESSFDINRVDFDNVSKEFEKKFRAHYSSALGAMSDSKDRLTNASGANTLGILEKMGQHIKDFDRNSDFESSYHKMLEEYEPFTEM